jgi:PAS domain-containing protein
MTPPLADIDRQAQLRLRALSRISTDDSEIQARSNPLKALTVLYELASSAETAPDALALLHELQVHQVELELQDDELRRSRLETEAALVRQSALYDRAPVAYLTLDAGLVAHEMNAAAVRLLGAGRDDLLGRSLVARLSPRGATALGELLAKVASERSAGNGLLPPATIAGSEGSLLAMVENDTVAGRFLVVLVEGGQGSIAA